MRATCFSRVIDNYDALLKLWNDCLETRLESDVRSRIIEALLGVLGIRDNWQNNFRDKG